MIIQTTSLLPRPRSESCFSNLDSDDDQGHAHQLKRSPKKEMTVNMLNLPLKPLKKKMQNVHKSEHALSPPPDSSGHAHHEPKSPFLSLKSPPAVLCQPSHSLYPGTKKLKKGVSVTTPLANVPPPAPPGTLPGYYLPPSRTPASTPISAGNSNAENSGTGHHHLPYQSKSFDRNK